MEMELVASDVPSSQSNLQVIFLVDITGSMGSQIEGVKQMISKFCEIERQSIDIHIWTYTENPGCHVSRSPTRLRSEDLVKYTQAIQLCHPPDNPTVNAGGGDGPENVVAGIAALLDSFDSKQNLLCFIVTDAAPHHKCYGNGTETKAEREWLTNAGFESTDIFCILCEVIDSLNITFVPVLYSESESNVWYQQAAVMTEGIVLIPKSHDSATLANGLGLLLDTFQKMSIERNVLLAKNIDIDQIGQGFKVLDIKDEDFEMLEEDVDDANKVIKNWGKVESSEDIFKKIFQLFETTVNRFAGKKSAKRCRAVNVDHISQSIKVFLMSMLYTTNSPLFNSSTFKEYTESLTALLKTLEAKDQKYVWESKLFNNFLQALDSSKSKLESYKQHQSELNQPIQCIVSLETVSEALKGLNQMPASEEELSQYMDLVLQLCLVRLLNVNFPLDTNKNPDFADAWSASIRSIEYSSVLSASSALALRNRENCLYTAPVSLNKNNAALFITHPNDLQLIEMYKSLSFFPTLQGLIQSHLISGGYKVFPSITFGLQASTLWYIMRIKHEGFVFHEYEWEFVRCLVSSIQHSAQIPAADVYNAAKNTKPLNPVDSIAKVMTGVLAFYRRNQVTAEQSKLLLRLVFEEFSGDVIAGEFRRATNDEGKIVNCPLLTDEEIVECFVSLEEISKFNAFDELHHSEEICKKGKHLGEDFLKRIQIRLLAKSGVMQNTIRVFQAFCVLFECDLTKESPKAALETIGENPLAGLLDEELLGEIFVESLILKKRTARYRLLEDTKEWVRDSLDRVSKENLHKSCVDTIKENLKPKFAEWTAIRQNACTVQNLEKVSQLIGDSYESFNRQLAEISSHKADVVVKLARLDTVKAFESFDKNREDFSQRLNTLGLALIIGDWTNGAVSQLRRSQVVLLEYFQGFTESIEKISAEMKKEPVCCRTTDKPNRHGHTLENMYPGIWNWTQEYEDSIKKSQKKLKKRTELHLKELKEYTLYYQSITTEVLQSADFGNNQKELIQWCLCGHKDVRILTKVKGFIERIKKTPLVAQQQTNWDVLTSQLLKKLLSSPHPWKHLENFVKQAEQSLIISN